MMDDAIDSLKDQRHASLEDANPVRRVPTASPNDFSDPRSEATKNYELNKDEIARP